MATQREKQTGGTALEEPQEQRTGATQAGTSTPATRGTAVSPLAVGGFPFFGSGMRATPFSLLRRVNEDFNQLFEALMRGGIGPGPAGRPESGLSPAGTQAFGAIAGWAPQIEIQQRKDALLVRADLAGVNPDDIDVTIENGMLRISGERRQERREEQEGVVHTELSYGSFSRTIPLPEGADESRVSATIRNGTLETTIPVTARERGRRVQVQKS